MSLIKDRAIVLRRLDYSESSQVLALFTRDHGQQRVIFKGAKRSTKTRPSIGIDLLEKGDAVFSMRPGKEDRLATLTDWRQTDGYRHLRENLGALYCAEYAADVTVQLTERHDAHAELYDSIDVLFSSLLSPPFLDKLAQFQWELLTHTGMRPEMATCVGCGGDTRSEATLFFSSHQGGTICQDCEQSAIEKRRLSRETADILIGETDANFGRAFPLLDYHLRELMGRPGRLSELVSKTLASELSHRKPKLA